MKLNHILITSLSLLTLLIISCTPDDFGSHANLPESSKKGSEGGTGVIFADVLPIFKAYCIRCHNSLGPDWTNYEAAKKFVLNGVLKKRVVTQKSMPQVGSPEAQSITQEERDLIGLWVDGGGRLNQDSEPVPPQPPGGGTDNSEIWDVANKCISCHGSTKPNSNPNIPLISGQRREYIKNQLLAFASDQRTDTILNGAMNGIAKQLTPDEIEMVSSIYSTIKIELPPPNTDQLPEFPEQDNYYAICGACHFDSNNQSRQNDYPNIAGQNAEYLFNQMIKFKQGERTDVPANGYMNLLFKNIDQETINSLSIFIESLRTKD